MINIAVAGAAGRMGRHLVTVCQETKGVRCNAASEHAVTRYWVKTWEK